MKIKNLNTGEEIKNDDIPDSGWKPKDPKAYMILDPETGEMTLCDRW